MWNNPKRPIRTAGLSLLVWCSFAHATPAERVVLISIDGLSAEDAVQLASRPADTPRLQALLRSGAQVEGVIPTTPANTFPNHVTMVTGVAAARHGILDNDRFAPATGEHGLFYHYYSDIRVTTLFDAVEAAGLTSLAVWWPVTTGAPIASLLADVPGDVRERGRLIYASATPDIRRVLQSPQTAATMTDALRLEAAIAGLNSSPAFVAVHFTEFDAAQHDAGIGSQEAMTALARIDGYVGELLDALEVRRLRDRTAIVIASDHGFAPLHSAVFPASLFRAYGLLEIDDAGDVTRWDAYPWPGGGALAIYLNPASEDLDGIRQTVDHIIEILADHPADFVHAVYRGSEAAQWGGYPDAYALINARHGFAFGGDLDSVLLRSNTKTRAVHGFVPDRPAMRGALILSGAGIAAGARMGEVHMEDIAPTIAHLLGISLPEAEGSILKALLAD